MSDKFKIKGFKRVSKNLNRAIKEIEGKSLKGLILAAIYLRRDMNTTSPTVPVDFRNLEASFFIVTGKGIVSGAPSFKGKGAGEVGKSYTTAVGKAKSTVLTHAEPFVIIGFGANYAIYVHENYGAKFKKSGSGAGFLLAALKRNHKKILSIIATNIK